MIKKPPTLKQCTVCGNTCRRLVRKMCSSCYCKWYHKNKEPTRPKTLCKSCNTYQIHFASGMCKKCYLKAYYHKTTHNIPYTENKTCSKYLGEHIAEQVLSKVFKNVKMMPTHNPGYDFICNHGKKIDVKSACLSKHGNLKSQWVFRIKHNTFPDYFLCLAFDNRKDLNPQHIWLIPGNVLNKLITTSISISTVDKWNKYELDISKTLECCNEMKRPARQMCCHASPNPECGRKV